MDPVLFVSEPKDANDNDLLISNLLFASMIPRGKHS